MSQRNQVSERAPNAGVIVHDERGSLGRRIVAADADHGEINLGEEVAVDQDDAFCATLLEKLRGPGDAGLRPLMAGDEKLVFPMDEVLLNPGQQAGIVALGQVR